MGAFRGVFFKRFLRNGVALRMLLIGSKFAPVMPMQELVQRRQPHLWPQRGFELRLDLSCYQNATHTDHLQKWLEQFSLLLVGEVLIASTAASRLAAIIHDFAASELVTQSAYPAAGYADGLTGSAPDSSHIGEAEQLPEPVS
ncbi:MAG: hypothetical protein A2V79_00535 [Betaproteobacteria bacterium RBG_16_56_24]|nr:MAG: hypothetical protein A2V79_00535 [Betaproteobacteria bacterium RBG_16_56_24]